MHFLTFHVSCLPYHSHLPVSNQGGRGGRGAYCININILNGLHIVWNRAGAQYVLCGCVDGCVHGWMLEE